METGAEIKKTCSAYWWYHEKLSSLWELAALLSDSSEGVDSFPNIAGSDGREILMRSVDEEHWDVLVFKGSGTRGWLIIASRMNTMWNSFIIRNVTRNGFKKFYNKKSKMLNGTRNRLKKIPTILHVTWKGFF